LLAAVSRLDPLYTGCGAKRPVLRAVRRWILAHFAYLVSTRR